MQLKKIVTKTTDGQINGWMIPIFKNYDIFFQNYNIKYIYATSVNANCTKGPKLHLKRNCRLIPLKGKGKLIKKINNNYEVLYMDSNNPYIFEILSGTTFQIITDNEEMILLNLCDHSWEPNDSDDIPVKDWNYEIQ